ncbi:MAG: transglutaminase family protein [Azoarcus sp.]|jgi:transglutaminase-like putative cysteine protease|nr:transglutaminase family protein [Azoarcus sp.]MDX9839595.1 transglutaminase family protein [Azoarcus sp.]
MARLKVSHRTVYRYSEPVAFSEHRFMCRPRDSHDLRLVDTGISISPQPTLRWIHDVFSNSVLIASFEGKASELVFDSTFVAEHYPVQANVDMIEPHAERLPFSYEAGEIPDLARCNERQYADPEHRVDAWVRQVCADAGTDRTLDVLIAITNAIKAQFAYESRDEEGTRTPIETLNQGSGSCRDFALFMMEAVRSLGLAARFVSGYLYDESLLGAESGMVGGGASHAWVHVYLPGAGWLPFDPTNAIVGGRNLIRVAVVRDPSQAAPLTGSYIGSPDAFLGMTVEVKVTVEAAAELTS